MALTLSWTSKDLLASQSLLINDRPEWTIEQSKAFLFKNAKTRIFDNSTGALLGEIDWQRHAIRVAGRTMLTREIKRRKGRLRVGVTRLWKWSDIEYSFICRGGEWTITMNNGFKHSRSNPTAYFDAYQGLFTTGKPTFSLEPNFLMKQKGEEEFVFLVLAVMYSEVRRCEAAGLSGG